MVIAYKSDIEMYEMALYSRVACECKKCSDNNITNMVKNQIQLIIWYVYKYIYI